MQFHNPGWSRTGQEKLLQILENMLTFKKISSSLYLGPQSPVNNVQLIKISASLGKKWTFFAFQIGRQRNSDQIKVLLSPWNIKQMKYYL